MESFFFFYIIIFLYSFLKLNFITSISYKIKYINIIFLIKYFYFSTSISYNTKKTKNIIVNYVHQFLIQVLNYIL